MCIDEVSVHRVPDPEAVTAVGRRLIPDQATRGRSTRWVRLGLTCNNIHASVTVELRGCVSSNIRVRARGARKTRADIMYDPRSRAGVAPLLAWILKPDRVVGRSCPDTHKT